MTGTQSDLISMADIARMSGQSRATVGNWKARSQDFPAERSRGSRGPLYNRFEVIAWLESTNRAVSSSPDVAVVWELADGLREELTIEESLPLLLLLLAMVSKSGRSGWRGVMGTNSDGLDAALRTTARELFSFADDLLPFREIPGESVGRAISTMSALEPTRVPVVADVLLEQAANAIGSRGGEFLSPAIVRRLVVALAEPTGSVYNPASGISQLMVDAAKSSAGRPTRLFGQEIDRRIWAMAQLNLELHGIVADLALGDVFEDDRFPQLRADRVISIPPWNQRLDLADEAARDPRWVWGEPGPNDGNSAWIQHCLFHLAENGRAVLVLPTGVLFQGGRAGRIRQRLVKAGLLHAVIALPAGLFSWTSVSCAVLVLVKGRSDVDGGTSTTLMIDVEKLASREGRRPAVMDEADVDDVAELYRKWASGHRPNADFAAVATFDDLAANDFVIDPGRYLADSGSSESPEKSRRERLDLTKRLHSLSEISFAADTRLMKLLEPGR